MKNIVGLFLSCLLAAGCYHEDELSSSSEPELIYGKYTLPQGNHEYDNDIVAFYKEYSSLLLYKFTEIDFGWTPTGFAGWEVATDTVRNDVSASYEFKPKGVPADEEYVGHLIELLEEKWFKHLSDTLMLCLPQRILLCDVIENMQVGLGYEPPKEERTCRNVFSGYFHIAVGGANERILTMTAADKNQLKNDINIAFFEKIEAILSAPMAFRAVSTYGDGSENGTLENGILNSENRTSPQKDWMDYIRLGLSTTTEGLQADYFDAYPKVKEKYDIMAKYLKDEFKFDIAAVGNNVEIQ